MQKHDTALCNRKVQANHTALFGKSFVSMSVPSVAEERQIKLYTSTTRQYFENTMKTDNFSLQRITKYIRTLTLSGFILLNPII